MRDVIVLRIASKTIVIVTSMKFNLGWGLHLYHFWLIYVFKDVVEWKAERKSKITKLGGN